MYEVGWMATIIIPIFMNENRIFERLNNVPQFSQLICESWDLNLFLFDQVAHTLNLPTGNQVLAKVLATQQVCESAPVLKGSPSNGLNGNRPSIALHREECTVES